MRTEIFRRRIITVLAGHCHWILIGIPVAVSMHCGDYMACPIQSDVTFHLCCSFHYTQKTRLLWLIRFEPHGGTKSTLISSNSVIVYCTEQKSWCSCSFIPHEPTTMSQWLFTPRLAPTVTIHAPPGRCHQRPILTVWRQPYRSLLLSSVYEFLQRTFPPILVKYTWK